MRTGRFNWTLYSTIVPMAFLAAACGPESGEKLGHAVERVSHVTNVSVAPKTLNQSEEGVAIDPANANNVFIGTNSEDANAGILAAFSTNGGTNWNSSTSAGDANAADFLIANADDTLPSACCDPTATWDQFSNLFYGYLGGTGVAIVISTDGGANFATLTQIVASDQPTIASGPGQGGVNGSLWLAYDPGTFNTVVRGATVTGAGAANVGAFGGAVNVNVGQFGDIAVGPNGQVIVAGESGGNQSGANINVAVDPDGLGPQPFGAITSFATDVGLLDRIPAQNNPFGTDAEPSLAYDRSGGAHDGRVYLVYVVETAAENNDMNIVLRFSDDDGANWSNEIRVNDDNTTNSQWLPKVSVDQTTGYVAVTWHDARNDDGMGGAGDTDSVANNNSQFFSAISIDGGQAFLANQQVSQGTSDQVGDDPPSALLRDIDYGDFSGMSFSGGFVHPAWADNSNSTGDNPDGALSKYDVYTAAIPAPTNPAGAFPTGDPNDGKLIAITGEGIASVDIPSVSLFIKLQPGETQLSVDVFDGDQAGSFDFTPGDPTNSCYRLMSDADADGVVDPGEEVIAIQPETFFGDAVFTNLFTGAVHPSAANASGAHIYRLDVSTGPGSPTATDCPASDATKAIINGFKVKSNGQVSIEYGDFTFVGADAAGGFASPDPFFAGGVDTDYNGSFDFYMDVSTMTTPASLTFQDRDADDVDDDVPGVATGANSAIEFLVFDGNGNLAFTQANPSGNYDALSTDLDTETNTVATGGVGGFWRWHWDNVLTENAIHVWPPVFSPPRAAVYGAPITKRVPVTAAQPLEYWLAHPGQLASLLPVTLGDDPHSPKVRTLREALCILNAAQDDHDGDKDDDDDDDDGHGHRHGHGDRHDGDRHDDDMCRNLCGAFGGDHDHRMCRGGRHGRDGHADHFSGPHHGFHARFHRRHHHADPTLDTLEDLIAELLVTELNVALDASRGQDLTVAFLYGRLEQVADVIELAEEIIEHSKHCKIANDQLDDAEFALTLLQAINAGDVTFVDPNLQPPPTVTVMAAAAARSSSASHSLF